MATESRLENKCCKWAKDKHGIRTIKNRDANGLPDRLFLYKGMCIFVEFKAPGSPLSPLQAHTCKQLVSEGFVVSTIQDYDAFVNLITIWVRYVKKITGSILATSLPRGGD